MRHDGVLLDRDIILPRPANALGYECQASSGGSRNKAGKPFNPNLMQAAHLLRRSWIQTKTQNGVCCSEEANVAGMML